jgi:protocatechuate 3,4-dioxygenase beta subunit
MSGQPVSIRLSRRAALTAGLGLGAGLGAVVIAGRAVATSSAPDDGGVCLLTPQTTQGPYWFDPKLERADITEERPGIPLKLAIRVVEGATCVPLSGARVDVWHCDAAGVYSGYDGQGKTGSTEGQTFLRGHQPTDARGLANFVTVYPGWYRGRTTHIHVKVFLDEDGQTNVLTCQLFFPDALSEWIYENVSDYARPGEVRDTLNATDMIAEGQGRSTFGYISEQADCYAMTVTLGVDRAARSTEQGFGPGGPPPGDPPSGGSRPAGPPPGDMGPPPGGPPGHEKALTGDARVRAMVPGLKPAED